MSRSRQAEASSPVSFTAHVSRLPQKGITVVIEADERQRTELSRIHGLLSVESYRAELHVGKWKRNGVRVQGRVTADITQECVVTLDPVSNHLDEEVAGVFLPEDSKLGRLGFDGGGEIMIDPEGEDSPETFSGDAIDVGALAEQYFGLAIDPYPRRQGAAAPAVDESDSAAPDEPEWRAKLRKLASES